MSIRKYFMPRTVNIGSMDMRGFQLNRNWANYLRGVEDVSGRVAAAVDTDTGTTAQIIQALKDAGLMKES